MRDPARIGRVLATLRAEWLTQPDTRLTQLIVNATRVSGGVGNYGFTRLYNTEDEDVPAPMAEVIPLLALKHERPNP